MRAVLALTLALLTPPAAAEEVVRLRGGSHPGFGRVVFDWDAPPEYRATRDGDRLRLNFPAAAQFDLAALRHLPPNVAGVALVPGGVELALRPGARVRHWRLGARLVVDVSPPAAGRAPVPRDGAAPASAAAPALAAATPRAPAPVVAHEPPPTAAPRAPVTGQVPVPRVAASPVAPPSLAPPAVVSPPVASSPVASPPVASPTVAPSHAASGLSQVTPAAAAPTGVASGSPASAPAAAGPSPDDPPGTRAHPVTAAPPPPLAAAPGRPELLTAQLVPQAGQAKALRLPLGPEVGAVALRRGDTLLLVFDAPRRLDLGALAGDPVFGATEVLPNAEAVVLRVPAAPPLQLTRDPQGWLIRPAPDDAAPNTPLNLVAERAPQPRLSIPAQRPGRVLTLADPQTGLPLLLGTVRQPGQAFPLARRLPQLELPATLLGLAVLAQSDSLVLRALADRFVLLAEAGTRLALDDAAARPDPAAGALSRSFDLPGLPLPQLLARWQAQQAAIGAAPPLGRGPLRRQAAETLLALALPQEAQAMLALAAAEDPAGAADPARQALTGIAALLADRPAEAAPLADAALPPSDELTFWRALLAAGQQGGGSAAPALGATLPLLQDYAEPLRARLLPAVAQALADGGEIPALRRLLATVGDTAPALARAQLAEAEGHADQALAQYEAIAAGRDRRARARALRRAVELRLATGRSTVAEAAQTLGAGLLAWRGGPQEIETRRRVAELRRLAGDARGALALLRETAAAFPEQAARLQPALVAAFAAAIEQEPPVAAVALYDAYPDLRPDGEPGAALAATLADRLLRLDLPDRASALLQAAIPRTAEPTARAELGLRLARLRLAEADAVGTLASLAATDAPDLPPPLAGDRARLAALAEARRGRRSEALALLAPFGPALADTRAELLAEAQDWAGAAAALGQAVAAALPDEPAPLPEAMRRDLVRQAALLALAGDEAGLAALRTALGGRMSGGALAEAFGLLTSEGLGGLRDLPRLQRELQLFRTMPTRLEALRAGGPVTR